MYSETSVPSSTVMSRKRDLPHLNGLSALNHQNTSGSPSKRAKQQKSDSFSKPSTPASSSSSNTAELQQMTPPATKSSRPNMSASSSITLDMLRPHFEQPLAQVAKHFGICVTLLKKICRKHGISRWPHRQITGLRKSIASMEHAIGYFEGVRREAYAEQLAKQKAKLTLLLEDPTQCNPVVMTTSDEVSEEEDASASSPPPATSANAASYQPLYQQQSTNNTHKIALPSTTLFGGSMLRVQQQRYQFPSTHSFSPEKFDAGRLAGLPRPPLSLDSTTSTSFAPPRPAASPIYLPPLRMENRPLLPPISSLVTSANW